MDRSRRQGLRLAAAVRGLPSHAALALRHRDRPEPLPGAVPGRHPHRRLPDGTVAQGPPAAARQPFHCRRHRARQDHRGGPHRPRAAPAPEGEHHRRRGAALGAGAVEGRAGGPLRPRLRDSRPGVSVENAPGARLRGQPVAHPQPLPGLPQPVDRPELRGPSARVAGTDAAREPADPRRGPPRRPRERRALRDRNQVHSRNPRPGRALRAPPVPVRDAAQRPLEQLLDSAGASGPVPVHPRRQGAGQGCSGRRDGAPPEGGHPRGSGRLPEAQRRAGGHREPAAGRPRAGALLPARRVPHNAGAPARERLEQGESGCRTARRRASTAAAVVD